MANIDTPIDALRDRLTQLLADWGAEMSMVLKELEDARGRLSEIESSAVDHEEELVELKKRITGQETLIETLRGDADDAGKLRKTLNSTELELEKTRADLESKVDLIKMLRADGDKKDAAKKSLERVEKALAEQRAANANLEQRLRAAEEAAAASHDDSAELAAVRAELDAKSSLVKTLRADANRAEQLEERLDEKRATIAKLEDSLESQAKTIAELKESVSRWKEKFAGAKNSDDSGATTLSTVPDLPLADFDDDEEADPEAQAATDVLAERTLAINMRDALRDARKTQERGDKKVRAAES